MKGFAYLKDENMIHVHLKYPDNMPDDPTLDDLALYVARHRLEEGLLIREHGIHTQLFLKLVHDKRQTLMGELMKEWEELDDTT